MRKQFFSRVLNRLYTNFIRKFNEHSVSNDCHCLKYLYFKPQKIKDKKCLIVCFPAFADNGSKYNYVHTLKDIDAAKIFFLDDFGDNHRGNYLLGVETLVCQVINNYIERIKPNKIIFIGSSKGGYSALYYSLFYKDIYLCIAAPQYFLGNYLFNEKMMPNLIAIIGKEVNPYKIEMLNCKLSNLIQSSDNIPKTVYLHYSDKEHTYAEHIQYMLNDLKIKGVDVCRNVEHYENHMDLVYYYPDYLKKTIHKILDK